MSTLFSFYFALYSLFYNRHDGDDILIGGANSEDHLFGNDGNDLAAGDCVRILFAPESHILSSVTSSSTHIGKKDEIMLGNGSDIGIGGHDSDTIHGNEGMDIIVSVLNGHCS